MINPDSPFFHEERHASLAAFSQQLLTICGAGTLGGNLAEALARMGFARLRLIDKDRVEMRNLSTQPFSRAEVGAPKARTLANTLYRAVQAKVEPQVVELNTSNVANLLKGSALIVDAFDHRSGFTAVSEGGSAISILCMNNVFRWNGLYGNGQWE